MCIWKSFAFDVLSGNGINFHRCLCFSLETEFITRLKLIALNTDVRDVSVNARKTNVLFLMFLPVCCFSESPGICNVRVVDSLKCLGYIGDLNHRSLQIRILHHLSLSLSLSLSLPISLSLTTRRHLENSQKICWCRMMRKYALKRFLKDYGLKYVMK